jgi:hypothetical protein
VVAPMNAVSADGKHCKVIQIHGRHLPPHPIFA